ncbi:TPA: hypothetical protein ACH3X2_013864 [Trebouxia sp. C0005]
MTNAVHHSDRKATAVGSGSSTPDTVSGTALPAAFDARMVVFQQLKPHTSQLLLHRDSPARLQASLQRLKTVIQDADADGLNSPGCMDYALFPLMFGVDSVAATRQAGAKTASSEVSMPATRSDAVAESLLDSCTLLLLRCPAQSGEQLLELMDRFASIASLSSNSAAEEVRLKAIQCISAMLISSASKSAPSGPVSALKDPSKAPLIAYLFSILMKAAEGEMKAGLTGSKTLSAAALKAVRCLTQAVNDGDALAFVLPGLASGLAKIMISAGGSSKRPSGSKVGSESVVEGLQAFTSIVTATLGDLHAQAIAESEQAQAELSAQEALTALSKLAIQRQGRSTPISEPEEEVQQVQQQPMQSGQGQSMRPARDKAWVRTSAARLQVLIAQVLPPLAAHPRVAVRTALAQAVTQLLEHCSIVLQDPNQALYEVLFTLAQDEWPQVSNHCHAWLCRCLPAQHKGAPLGGSVPAIVQRQLGGLLPALQSGEEAGTLHARRLTTALQACSPQQLTNLLVASPVNASSWASTLCRCFAFERSAAALLLYNTSQAGPHAPLLHPTSSLSPPPTPAPFPTPTAAASSAGSTTDTRQQPSSTHALSEQQAATATTTTSVTAATLPLPSATASSPLKVTESDAHRHSSQDSSQTAKRGAANLEACDHSGSLDAAFVLLPRMQLGMTHIATAACYTAVANVARTLAKSAVAADQSNTISAGGAVLHGIVQDLLQVFEAQMPPQNTQSQASSSHTALGTEAQPSIAWQGRAAAAVVALTEVLYGASPAWQPAQAPISGSPTSSDDSRRRHNGGGSTSSSTAAGDEAVSDAAQQGSRNGENAERHGLEPASDVGASVHGSGPLEQLVVQVLGDFSSADVWQLPTHVEPDASPEGSALTPQALGENAVLIRALLEAVGTFARVLGPRFASNGLILRKVLLLLLERLADPCPSVAASAGAALGSLCLHCCYPSRQALLTHNVDYLVDGLCRQLRSLQSYPRAPYLFAAVLQQAGAGPQLLPLLADPARAAFQGLSITARHNAAFHVYPFLQVLMHIVTICQAEAAVLLAATQAAADQIKDAVKAAQPHSAEDDPDEVSGPSDIDAIRAYFEQHNKAKAGAAADADVNYTAGLDVIEQLNSRRRQIHSVAVLAHASADVATPLLLAATLKVGLLASKVGLVALKALHATTAALDLYEQAITPVTSKKEGVGPPPSDTPQLLPSVHAIWGPLIGALRNDRPALVQAAMECLVGVCQLAGPQFMMRRVQTEAWPALVHLLKQGIPERRHLPYPAGRGALMAPAALQQMRYRVLHCVRQLGDAAQGSTLWKGMTDKVAEVVIVYLDGSQTATVQEAAAQALLKVAKLDPDAVWLLLQMHTSQNEFTQSPDRRTFPEAQQLLGGESATDSALQLPVVSPHLSALLHEVERMQSSWHKDT